MESIYLLGSEEVGKAASRIATAAEEMNRAASNMNYALEQHQRFLVDWLSQFETILKNK